MRSRRSAGVRTTALRTVMVKSMPKSSAARVFEPGGGFFRKARTFSFIRASIPNAASRRAFARLWGPGANSGQPMLSLASRG
jgi:chemotaxis methyl-accepting protein methylase